MQTKLSIAVTVVALLVGAVLLTGCPKKDTELQGAPQGTMPMAPGQHMMPGGQMMPDNQMKPPASGAQAPAQAPAAAGGKEEMASCPVLGTTMAKKNMIPYEYQGKTYYFCCQDCVDKFKANPDKYIQHPAAPKPAGEPMQH
ncbi:YHS domain-containing protein [bacterium]|nr:YHS domain-containing protein [bacterium]